MTEVATLVEGINTAVATLRTQHEADSAELRKEVGEIRTALASIPQGAPAAQPEFKSTKELIKASSTAEFRTFARKGANGAEYEFRADASTSTTNGVFPLVDQAVGRLLHDSSPLAKLINHVTVGNGSPYVKVYNKNDAGASRIGEAGSWTVTDSNTTHKVEIQAKPVYAFPKITLEAQEDSFYDVESEVLWSGLDKITRLTAAEILNGTGFANNQSIGVLTVTQQVVAGDTTVNRIDRLNVVNALAATAISEDDLINLIYALPDQYKPKAGFVVKNTTAAALRKLEDEDGNKIWERSLQAGQPDMLLGYPVHICNDMPAIAASALTVLFGDFEQGVTMVTRTGVNVKRDELKNPGYVTYIVRGRMSSAPTDGRALVALKQLAS